MDNLKRASIYFEAKAYKECGINVDELSDEVARRALKRLLGIAADHGAMKYISACQEVIRSEA